MRVVLLLIVLLAGCATPGPQATDAKDAWIGAPYDEVVSRWGAPARSTRLSDGREAHTWVSEGSLPRASVWPSVGIGVGSGGVGIGTGVTFGSGGSERVRCERTLVFKDGWVVEQNWEGPAEYCNGFRRMVEAPR
jgi:hypothetical protein